jgi:hypothetical protein
MDGVSQLLLSSAVHLSFSWSWDSLPSGYQNFTIIFTESRNCALFWAILYIYYLKKYISQVHVNIKFLHKVRFSSNSLSLPHKHVISIKFFLISWPQIYRLSEKYKLRYWLCKCYFYFNPMSVGQTFPLLHSILEQMLTRMCEISVDTTVARNLHL